jgi:rubrerythrin
MCNIFDIKVHPFGFGITNKPFIKHQRTPQKAAEQWPYAGKLFISASFDMMMFSVIILKQCVSIAHSNQKRRTSMPQEPKLQEAIKLAIHAKKDLVDFYQKAAEITKNPEGKRVFELLANEVKENTKRFFDYYKSEGLGSFEEFMAMPPHPESAMLVELQKALDENIHERKAREIALREEEDLEKNFHLIASKVVDPMVRKVFERVAEETHNHYEMIESEYARTMGMVHETDVDTYVRE